MQTRHLTRSRTLLRFPLSLSQIEIEGTVLDICHKPTANSTSYGPKLRASPSKIRHRPRLPALTIFDQYRTGRTCHSHWARKRCSGQPERTGRSQALTLCGQPDTADRQSQGKGMGEMETTRKAPNSSQLRQQDREGRTTKRLHSHGSRGQLLS